MRYDYSVVRFVPDSFRGEFVNVAVIVGSAETGEWDLRQVDNPLRARRLEGGPRLSAVWTYLDAVAELIERERQLELDQATRPLDRAWLRGEHARLRNLVQVTEPAPVIADDVDEALTKTFEAFVVDPQRRPRRTRKAAVTALRNAFVQELLPPDRLHEKAKAVVGKQQAPIDFAIGNGHLVQLAHGWSFQAQDPIETVQQIKAWSWTLRDVRDLGGLVRVPDRPEDYPVPQDVAIDVVYVPPETDDGARSLDEALEVFENLRVKAVPTSEARVVAADARKALGAL